MTIELGKQYRTRDGREVRIYAVDGGGNRPVHGAICTGDEWQVRSWFLSGEAAIYCDGLIEVKPRIKRKIWVNWYRHDDGSEFLEASTSKGETCDVGTACIACVEIDIDVEEGHGL